MGFLILHPSRICFLITLTFFFWLTSVHFPLLFLISTGVTLTVFQKYKDQDTPCLVNSLLTYAKEFETSFAAILLKLADCCKPAPLYLEIA